MSRKSVGAMVGIVFFFVLLILIMNAEKGWGTRMLVNVLNLDAKKEKAQSAEHSDW